MKKHLLVLVVCLLTNVAFAQNVDLSQLKQQWKTEGQEDVELSYLDEKPYTGKVFAKHSNGKIGLVGEYNNGKKKEPGLIGILLAKKNVFRHTLTTKKKEQRIIGTPMVKLQKK